MESVCMNKLFKVCLKQEGIDVQMAGLDLG